MTVFDYRPPTDSESGSPDDQMKLAIQKRRTDNDETVMKILSAILRKNRDSLSIMDKAFLQARSSYMTEAERDAYKDVLEEELEGVKPPEDEKVIKDVKEPEPTRAELEAQATALGIDKPGDKKLYPTNKSLKEAILAAQG
jgi:hypothetical protein